MPKGKAQVGRGVIRTIKDVKKMNGHSSLAINVAILSFMTVEMYTLKKDQLETSAFQ